MPSHAHGPIARRVAAMAALVLAMGMLALPSSAAAATPEATPTSITLFPTVIDPTMNSAVTVPVSTVSSVDRTMTITTSDSTALPFLSPIIDVPAGSQVGGAELIPNGTSVTEHVTISVTGNGVTVSAVLTINPEGTPPPPPTLSSFTITPNTVLSGTSTTGKVTLPGPAPAGGLVVQIGHILPLTDTVPATVTVPAGATSVSFTITTFAQPDTTADKISASNGDTVLGAGLVATGTATGPQTSFSFTLAPSTVPAGTSATGTVTVLVDGVVHGAPAGGLAVTLASNNAAATVPAGITVPAGASTATFAITTHAVAVTTSAAISATALGGTVSHPLTITPAAGGGGGTPATLSVTATGRNGVTVSSNPAGIHVAVGSTGSASLTTGTSITLSASDGRDVIWSGACSSAGKKVKTCTFTLTGNAGETANVQ